MNNKKRASEYIFLAIKINYILRRYTHTAQLHANQETGNKLRQLRVQDQHLDSIIYLFIYLLLTC
jgi:hypothetical protein